VALVPSNCVQPPEARTAATDPDKVSPPGLENMPTRNRSPSASGVREASTADRPVELDENWITVAEAVETAVATSNTRSEKRRIFLGGAGGSETGWRRNRPIERGARCLSIYDNGRTGNDRD